MSRKKIILIIVTAFVVGVIVTLTGLLIFRKYEISADTDTDKTDYMGTVVLDGFAIPIPNKYIATVDDEVGLSYCDKGTFEMSISVAEGSYELTMQEMDSLSADIDEWFELKKPFDELAVDKASYIYCVYEDEGETVMLAYKKADAEHVFEIMVRCLAVDWMRYQTEAELTREYESYILIADSLLNQAKPTDEENTPSGVTYVADEMYADLEMVVTEKFVPEDILYDEAEGRLVTYQVEDNFYLIAQEIKSDNYSMKTYCDTDRDIKVTVVADGNQRSDMNARKLMTEGRDIWTDLEMEVESMEINGNTFYYYAYTEEYLLMDEPCEKYYFEAATDMKDGMIYRLSASSETSKDALNIDTYLKFLTIE